MEFPKGRGLRGRGLIIATLLHALTFMAMFSPWAMTTPVMSEGPAGEAISVELFGYPSGAVPPVSVTQSASDAFEDLRREAAAEIRGYSRADAVAPTADLAELLGDPDSHSSQKPLKAASGSQSGAQVAGDTGAQVSLARIGRASPLGLGRSLPCWRRPASRLPVRLAVVVDDRGRLVGPPRFVKQDRRNRMAEAQAMRAMAGCAPFALSAPPGRYRSFELDFSRDAGWVIPTGTAEVR